MQHSPSWEVNQFSFPSFYGAGRFITAYTSAHHLSLSYATSFQSIPPHSTSWRSILILSSPLCLGPLSGFFPSGFLTKPVFAPFLSPKHGMCHAHFILLDLITQTIFGEQYRSLSSSLCSFLHSPVTLSLSVLVILLCTPSQTLSVYVLPSIWATKFHTHTKQQGVVLLWLEIHCVSDSEEAWSRGSFTGHGVHHRAHWLWMWDHEWGRGQCWTLGREVQTKELPGTAEWWGKWLEK